MSGWNAGGLCIPAVAVSIYTGVVRTPYLASNRVTLDGGSLQGGSRISPHEAGSRRHGDEVCASNIVLAYPLHFRTERGIGCDGGLRTSRFEGFVKVDAEAETSLVCGRNLM